MNPNFVSSVADRNAVRNEYIKNLQLETANNLTNYNANQIFKQTGQLPPSITAMVDTRSITEKYADQQKARVAVIAGLREITDGANANEIVDQIHGRDMIALLNSLPAIVADIKPKWQLGITAPAFIAYWKKYQRANNYNAGVSIYPVYKSNQLLTSIVGLLQNIRATLPQTEDFDALRTALGGLPRTDSSERAEETVRQTERMTRNLGAGVEELSRQDPQENPIQYEEDIQRFQTMIERNPPRSDIVRLTSLASIASATNVSPQEAERVNIEVLSLLQPEGLQQEEDYGLGTLQAEKELKTPSSAKSEGATTVASMSTQAPTQTTRGRPASQQPPFPSSFDDLLGMEWKWAKPYIKQIIDDPEFNKADIEWGEARNISKLTQTNFASTNLRDLLIDYFSEQQPIFQPKPAERKKPAGGTGVGSRPRIQGRGVNANRTHAPTTRLTSGGNYRFTPKVDKTKKVEKVPSYMAFGNYLIHQHDLVGGTLKLRHKSGASITDIPTQAIGGQLKKVLLTLTGTGSPSFEDINELSEKDKALLNKVVKKAKIDQRLLVPTPDKTKEEQDYNRLQILSGEINAGNNNPQIVKELKILLLRLKNGGRIPKRHYHEIMEDLMSIGY